MFCLMPQSKILLYPRFCGNVVTCVGHFSAQDGSGMSNFTELSRGTIAVFSNSF